MSRSRITNVLLHLETGGIQWQMKELLLGLDRDRLEPRVVAFTGFGNDYRSEIEATDTPVTLLPKRKGADRGPMLGVAADRIVDHCGEQGQSTG